MSLLAFVLSLAAAPAPAPPAPPPPTLSVEPLALHTPEDTPASAVVKANDPTARFTVKKKPKRGAVTVDETSGKLTFTPEANAHGTDEIVIEVRAGNAKERLTVPVTVQPVNDAPTVEPMKLGTREEEATGAPLTVKDLDGDPVTFSLGSPPKKGTATVNERGRVLYTPTKDATGDDRFVVIVSDGAAKVDAPVDVVVAPINDAPTVADAALDGKEDQPVTLALKATDVEGDALTWAVAKAPAHAVATVDAKTGALTVTPHKDWNGKDLVIVTVKDAAATASVAVPLVFGPVNDAPAVEPMKLATREEEATGAPLTVKDVDGDAFTFALGAPPKKGTATVNERGRVSYTPSKDQNGADRFVVIVSDGTAKVEAAIDVAVAPVNDAPVIAGAAVVGQEDTPATVSVAATDVDGDALAFTIAAAPQNGTAAIDAKTGKLTFTPKKDWHGKDSVTVTVKDAAASTTSAVAVTVAPVNDPPVIEAMKLGTREEEATGAPLTVRDVDGDAITFAPSTKAKPARGSVSVDAKGRVVYTPSKDQNGADRFAIAVGDGTVTVEAPVDVDITPVNDAPGITSAQLAGSEDAPATIALVATDVDGDALTWSVSGAPQHGTATVDAKTGKLTFTPKADWHGKDTITVAVKDASAPATSAVPITFAPVNDPPVIEPMKLATREEEATGAPLTVRDVDGDAITFAASTKTKPERGTVTVDAKGRVVYTPSKDQNGADRFAIAVGDGTVTVEAPVEVATAPVNDAPVATPASLTVAEDGTLTATLAGTDVDGDALSVRLVRGPQGLLTLDPKGALSWSPPKDFHGTEKLAFDVDDGKLSARGEATLTVTPKNDAPIVTGKPLATREDTAGATAVEAKDIDGDKLRFAVVRAGEKGTAVVDAATGAVTYTPRADVWGEDSVVVSAHDGTVAVETTVAVSIAAVQDAPRVNKATWQLKEDEPGEAMLPAIDVDGDALTFALVGEAKLGAVQLVDKTKGKVTFTPRQDRNGPDEVQFEVSDGTNKVPGALPMVVAAVNDAPLATTIALTTTEDRSVRGAVPMSDVDGDATRLVLVAAPKNATVRIEDATKGALLVDPARDFHGEVVFKVAAAEPAQGGLQGAPIEVKLTVKPENDSPLAPAQSMSTPEDTTLSGVLSASDVDGDKLRFRLVAPPARGDVVIDPGSGRFIFTPRKNVEGDDSFVYVVSDGAFEATGRVALRVKPVDDAPVATSGTLLSPRAGRVTGKLVGRDPEGQPLRFRIVQQPSMGDAVVLDETTGTFAYTPAPGSKGRTALKFVVEANGQASQEATVVIDVN